jgi:hypothetical protein
MFHLHSAVLFWGVTDFPVAAYLVSLRHQISRETVFLQPH